MKRTVEIEDTLDEQVETAIELVKDELISFLDENKPDSLPCLNNDLDYSGVIHEIIDGCVPIYTNELKDTWFLYSNELDEALDNAGLYSNADKGKLTEEQIIQSAYYCYLQEKVNEWYSEEAEIVFQEWKQPAEETNEE